VALTLARRSGRLLVLCVGLACREQPAAPPAEPPRRVDGVAIAGRHLEHVESRVACVRRHAGLQPGAWRVEDGGLVKLPLGDSSYVAVTAARTFDRATGEYRFAEARGFQLWLHDGRVSLEFDAGEHAGRAAFLDEGGERALFWVDLGGEDPFAPLRNVEAARAAAHAGLEARRGDRERAMDLGEAQWCGRLRCERRTFQMRHRRSDDRDAIADDTADGHALVERHIAELVAGVRRLYPIDDPACSLPLPRGP
jgi:hypothetical protein